MALFQINARDSRIHRFFGAGLFCLAIAAAAHGTLQVRFGPRPVEIHIRWAPDVDDSTRQAAERRYGLLQGALVEGRTWRYALSDFSRMNISALVSDVDVEDTNNIDRAAYRVSPAAASLPYSTSHPWIPVGLHAVAVLGLIIGLINISLGFVALVVPATLDRAMAHGSAVATFVRDPVIKERLSLLLVIIAMGACFFAARTMGLRADERLHHHRIEAYVSGNFATSPSSTIGGFHATATIVAYLTGQSQREDIRLFVLLISGATILVFWSIMRSLEPQASTVRTLQFVFFPLLFPFWFLIYTDVYALMFLLLAILALTRNRFHLAGTLMILSVAVRQSSIVWLALLGLWTLIVNRAKPIRQFVKLSASFGLGSALFLAFVIVNGGVAVGDRSSHPDMEFHTENVLFMLLCFSLMFLPLILSKLPQIARLHPAMLAGVLLSSVTLVLGTFRVDHGYNSPTNDYFLRNRLLEAMTSSPVAEVLASVAIALAVLTLCVIRLRRPMHYLIYPFAAFSVIPSWLIEQRYYLPAFALFMLFRESASPRVERALVAMNAAVALCLFVGIERGWFFL
jgi:alpha-1,2-glucosyltransferase